MYFIIRLRSTECSFNTRCAKARRLRGTPTATRHTLLCFCAISLLAPQPASAITIGTVPIGNVGNANDPADGDRSTGGIQNFGGVAYAYNIGTYEVTVGQYSAFLNAVAATDSYELYNTSMATNLNIAGIVRSGSAGSYSYSVIGSANKPVTYVNWGDAARFSNWLHNGQPTGAQNASTTEDGAYTLNGATTGAALSSVSRNARARWFVPSENEWYKAAYHQPAAQGGDVDNYWAYPTRTNTEPNSDQPPGALGIQRNVANFFRVDGLANSYNDGYAVTGSTAYSSSQNYLTDVGAYAQASSFYGTFDQGGNVGEWNEAMTGGTSRGIRGGWFYNFADDLLQSSARYGFTAVNDIQNPDAIGFRVASVPEPSTAVLAILAGGMMWYWRKRLK